MYFDFTDIKHGFLAFDILSLGHLESKLIKSKDLNLIQEKQNEWIDYEFYLDKIRSKFDPLWLFRTVFDGFFLGKNFS